MNEPDPIVKALANPIAQRGPLSTDPSNAMGSLEHRLAPRRARGLLAKQAYDIAADRLRRRERGDDPVDFGERPPPRLRKPVGGFQLLGEQHGSPLPMRLDDGFGTLGDGPAKSLLQRQE